MEQQRGKNFLPFALNKLRSFSLLILMFYRFGGQFNNDQADADIDR